MKTVGLHSVYMQVFVKITILGYIFRGLLIHESANTRIYTVIYLHMFRCIRTSVSYSSVFPLIPGNQRKRSAWRGWCPGSRLCSRPHICDGRSGRWALAPGRGVGWGWSGTRIHPRRKPAHAHKHFLMTLADIQIQRAALKLLSSPCKSRPERTWRTSTQTLFWRPWSTCNRWAACRRWQYLRRRAMWSRLSFTEYFLLIRCYTHKVFSFTFIIIRSSYGTGDITRHHCNHGSSQEPSTSILKGDRQLLNGSSFIK